MKVKLLKNLVKQDGPIHYRRNYTAVAELVLANDSPRDARVAFTIEQSPLGSFEITVSLEDRLDYPSLPVIQALKSHIQRMQRDGELR